MTLKFKDDGGTDRTITAIKFKDDGGVDRTISQIKFGANVIFSTTSTLAVVVAPTTAGADTFKTGHATTPAVTATPSGGAAPYTYLWTIEDALDGTPSINTPTLDTTTFSISGLGVGDFCTATGRCTVTDANGDSASDTCSITFYGGF